MAIQRIGPRPRAMVHQAGVGRTFDGTQPSNNAPTFDADGNLVFAPEAAADGSGLFEFEQDRSAAVRRVTISVPSADVAGWSLFVTDGVLDVLIETTAIMAASYAVGSVPIALTRGENLKLVMAGASAGIIHAKVLASTVDNAGEI